MPDALPLHRRQLLRGTVLLGGAAAASLVTPGVPALAARPSAALISRDRPELTHGVQSGDVRATRATVWARADRPARMLVELSATPSFRRTRRLVGPVLTPATDLTGKVAVTQLPPGADVHYRVRLVDLDADRGGEPVVGRFRTPDTAGERDIRFVWSGDLAGQGWGINPEFGGFRIFRAMRALEPDFFLCSGDTIYADGPIAPSVTLPDGRVWRNVVTQEKTKVAETLDEFRGQYRYNLIDKNLRAFNAVVPQVNQWDDHEVTNNWYPGEILDDPRYAEKRVDVLAARARQAFHEYLPIREARAEDGRIYRVIRYGPLLDVFVVDMRTYKDRNTDGRETVADGGVFGRRQLAWLKRSLAESSATWKVIAADLPIGLIVPDGNTGAIEGIAQGDGGRPLGRELEVADLLRFIAQRGITGTVWLTADVHYTAAHHYDPARASFRDFRPFWEFVSGPLNAGAFGPNALDPTFGPRAVFVAAPPRANTSPAEGYQFFGEVRIDAGTRELTVRLRDIDGRVLWRRTLAAED